MAYLTGYEYYENNGNAPENANWGSYQYVYLTDIVNNFMLYHVGNHAHINNVPRSLIIYKAKQIIKELNYDAFKEVKALMLNVCDTLRFVMPPDYVSYVRISVYKDGLLLPLTENIQAQTAKAYLQANDCKILFDQNGEILEPELSQLDLDRIEGTKKSIYLNENSPLNGLEAYNYNGDWYFNYGIGGRYGLNTETANANPTFTIDDRNGVINFDSTMSGELCLLEYVSDGMNGGDDTKVGVHKFFEGHIMDRLEYEILENKLGMQDYVVRRKQRRSIASRRNSMLRKSNIHAGRILMNLRARDKWIK